MAVLCSDCRSIDMFVALGSAHLRVALCSGGFIHYMLIHARDWGKGGTPSDTPPLRDFRGEGLRQEGGDLDGSWGLGKCFVPLTIATLDQRASVDIDAAMPLRNDSFFVLHGVIVSTCLYRTDAMLSSQRAWWSGPCVFSFHVNRTGVRSSGLNPSLKK